MAKRRHNEFVERSIMGALSFLKGSVFSDEYALRKGLLQSIDPRIKLATFAALILTVLFTRSIAVLSSLYALSLALACCSKIRLWPFLKRTWVFIPLFSLFIAIPALFSVFTPGETLIGVKIAGSSLTVTRQGLAAASLFVARVITSVSLAVLASVTTRHFELLKALRVFRISGVFIMTVGICYRYIYLFMEVIENTYLAVKSRAGRGIRYKKGQEMTGWNIASLWQRSYMLNEAVYGAMLSRGYSGEPMALNSFRAGPGDWAWLSFVLIVCAASLYYGRSHI